ncbi:MAG TPA: hypothetical protein VGJ75_25545 [Dongiaceae bacterium]
MVRPITTSSTSASSAPVAVHASAAADFSASETRASSTTPVESAQSQQTGAVKSEEMFRYNSYQFVYRQDIGRIVLIGQSPETGERVVQVPSEQVLRAYARTVRIERQLANPHTSQSPTTGPSPQSSTQLTRALVAAVSGDNHGSGVVSVSA